MRVDVAPTEADWMNSDHAKFTVYKEDFGHPLDGYITFEELKQHTAGVVEWPEFDGGDDMQHWKELYGEDEYVDLTKRNNQPA